MDKLEWQRIHRIKTNNQDTKKYEKTKKGFLMRTYRNMKSRVFGVQKQKIHLYLGKHLLSKEDFYSFSLADSTFNRLFEEWEKSNYYRKNTPSIDRINSSGGYELGNIRWLTHSENSKLGSHKRHGML